MVFLCPDETKSKYQNRYFFQRFRIISEAVLWQNKRENIREPGDRTTGAHGGTNRERKETAKVKERNLNDEVPISEMAELLGVEENTIYKKVGKLKDEFKVENKIVKRREPQENQGPESDVEVNLTPPKKAGSKTRKTNHRKTQKNQGFERKKNG